MAPFPEQAHTSQPNYVLGKLAVLGLLLSAVTWVPGLLLFSLQSGLAHNGWFWSSCGWSFLLFFAP